VQSPGFEAADTDHGGDLAGQVYLDPHPKALMLRNHV